MPGRASRPSAWARRIGLGVGALVMCVALSGGMTPVPSQPAAAFPCIIPNTGGSAATALGTGITSTVYLPMVCGPLYGRPAAASEWTQEAHDAQRTGFTSEEPNEPWTLLWTWNGPDATGGASAHSYDAPREARTVTGGGNIYVPAGTAGLYALSQATGRVVWRLNVPGAGFNATPAYDPGTAAVWAGASDGRLYKVDAASGNAQSYLAGNPINRSVLLVGNYAYAVTDDGHLHKVDMSALTASWVYGAGSPAGTALAYSASRDVIVFGTADLYVHAVNDSDGTVKWHVDPSGNPATFPYQYGWYWPVVAEAHGVVFLRMRLAQNQGLWGYPSAGSVWPATNAEARAFLVSHPDMQNLFALSLDSGAKQFIPAVGDGGTEEIVNGQALLATGPMPVVRELAGGAEVAYMFFRNGQTTTPKPSGFDGRWDSHLGEMVLDSTTVPGLAAGDLRFVRSVNAIVLTDEQDPLTMAGNTIFHAHWGASEAVRITDRSDGLGLTYANPIATLSRATVIRRQAAAGCSSKDAATHWTTCGLSLYGDSRYWSGPGWWTYWNVMDPPTPGGGSAYSDGVRPRYTYVSAGLVVVQGNGGELMVFRHQ